MSLTLVPVPLGHISDITIRALEVLRASDAIIVEETKESTQWLRAHQISKSPYLILNEHTRPEELSELTNICRDKNVALITDCGTPGFCDPGADLVRSCRQRNIAVKALPGPSSLMMLLSLSSRRLDSFLFYGFLPQETDGRKKAWQGLVQQKQNLILMDTPYRYQKLVLELQQSMPDRFILLATQLTQNDEWVFEGQAKNIDLQKLSKKAEFMLLIYA